MSAEGSVCVGEYVCAGRKRAAKGGKMNGSRLVAWGGWTGEVVWNIP